MTSYEVSDHIEDLVLWERRKLPANHPRRPDFGGYLIDKARDAGNRAYIILAGANMLPGIADLEAMVSGRLDTRAYCMRREAKAEAKTLQAELATAAHGATSEALRRALEALKGDA